MPYPSIANAGAQKANGTSSATLPLNPTIGNVLYCFVFRFNTTGAPTNTGNTFTQLGADSVDANGNHAALWRAPVVASSSGLVAGAAGDEGIIVVEITNDNGVDGSAVATQLGTTSGAVTFASGNVVTSGVNRLILAGLIDQTNSASWASQAPMTNIASATGVDWNIAGQYQAATAGSYNPTFTASATANQTAAMIAAAIAGSPDAPIITQQPGNQRVFIGQTATFNVAATTSGGGLHYQWYANGSPVGSDSASYTTAAATYADNLTAIYCDVSDSNGTTHSNHVYWLVTLSAPIWPRKA